MNKERYNQIIDGAYENYSINQPYTPIAGNNVGLEVEFIGEIKRMLQ